MPEALMPPPRRVHAPSSKAHRVRDVESDRVEPVGGATHSSKEASAFVADPHDPLIDMDVVPILVEFLTAFSNSQIVVVTTCCPHIKEVRSAFASPDALAVNAFHSFFVVVVRHN